MSRLIFFCGHAGCGKTTIAKKLLPALQAATGEAFCFLDKDTLYGPYSEKVMEMLTGDPHDRDSPTYLDHLRNPEYQGLLDTARENLALGVNAIVVGPLSREIRAHQLTDRAWLGVADDVKIAVVWVDLDDEVAHQRIVARAHPDDAYKIAHWDEYRARRFIPDPQHWPELLHFDNTAPTDADIAALGAALLAHTAG